MKLLIQHNFKTGLGDMYNDMVEYMTTTKKIYSYTDFGWISLFLLYGILEGNKKEKDFIKISF